jgi:tRNA threonylcarbamoyladenosine biosynthesis protein TsaB
MAMKILALDTTGLGCSVAISEGRDLIAELNFQKKQTHSKHLMGMIDHLFQVSGLSLADIDAFAASIGPGSFTGLRIGLSTIKGLSFVTGKPLVGVSSLESLAMGVPSHDLSICPLIDARKNEMYMACYSFNGNSLETVKEPCVAGPEEICSGISQRTLFTGTGVEAYGPRIKEKLGHVAVFASDAFYHIRARFVAELGFERLKNGMHDETLQIKPRYIRKSDAEINLRNASE